VGGGAGRKHFYSAKELRRGNPSLLKTRDLGGRSKSARRGRKVCRGEPAGKKVKGGREKENRYRRGKRRLPWDRNIRVGCEGKQRRRRKKMEEAALHLLQGLWKSELGPNRSGGLKDA